MLEVPEKGSQRDQGRVVLRLPEPHGVLLVAYLDSDLRLELGLGEQDAAVVHSPRKVLLDDLGRRLQWGHEESNSVDPVYAGLDLLGVREGQPDYVLEEDGGIRLLYDLVDD